MNTKKESRFQLYTAILSILLLSALFPLAEWVRVNLDPRVYKFLSGYLLGSISAMAIESLIHWWRMRKKGGFFASMPNLLERSFLFFLFAFILILGVVVWVVSWEGNTGIFFGAGALLAQGLVSIGLGQTLWAEERYSPSPASS